MSRTVLLPRAAWRALAATSLLVATSCTDSTVAPPAAPDLAKAPTAAQLFQRYVSLGTSNSMGVQSAGVFASSQRAAWPAQLAARAGVAMSLPLVEDPGCGPPLLAPLAANMVLVGAFGEDLVTAVSDFCAPLRSGITLPTGNVAISGAKARTALYSTPESEALVGAKRGEMYARVLAPGQTQVTAMVAQRPTFVSVELAANEVLPASTGRLSAMTPFEEWAPIYDEIVGTVRSTGARAVLVGLPLDAAKFPSIRRAREIFSQWPYLATLGISVSFNCYTSSNHVFLPGYILTLMSKAPTTATCADVPGTADYVLTASDIVAINARMAQMNAHIQARASENGYAYFSLESLFGLPKPSLDMYRVLFSNEPFGQYISLDGVHPSAAGQGVLATAAAQAISARYRVSFP